MKVIWGYGKCAIAIRNDGIYHIIKLRIDSNSYPIDTRVGYSYANIYSNREEVTEKIVRSFNIDVISDDGDQTDILELIYYLKRNDLDYVRFQLHECDQSTYLRALTWHSCLISEPSYNNFISDFQGGGVRLSLALTTKYSINVTDDKVMYIPYMDTSTGLWGTYPELPQYAFSKSIQNIGLIT